MSASSPSPPRPLVWFQGELVPANDLRLPAWNHGIGVADGVYETFRSWKGVSPEYLLAPSRLAPHLERLKRGCEMLSLRNPLSDEELPEICDRVLGANSLQAEDARLRIVVWRSGTADGGGEPSPDPAQAAVYALPVDQAALEARRGRGLRVITLRPSRVPGDPFHTVKHLNGIRPVLARLRCERERADDALYLNSRGEVCEAVWSNVFLVDEDGKTLRTPPVESPCLPGVTRERVVQIARELGLQVVEEAFLPSALPAAGEAFATSSVSEVMPIVEVDGTPVGDGRPGKTSRRLQEAFRTRMTSPLR